MNNKPLTDSVDRIPAKQVPATSVTATPKSSPIVCQDVIDMIDSYLSKDDITYHAKTYFKKGVMKAAPGKMKVHTVIQSLNNIMQDFIFEENDMKITTCSSVRNYFEGVSKICQVLDNSEIKVADDRLLCYIIGYMLKLLKKHQGGAEN